MRLITRRIHRAFPELDSYDDEQCLRFINAARGRVVRRVLAFIGLCLLFAILFGLSVGIVFGAAAALKSLGWISSATPDKTWMGGVLIVFASVAAPLGTAIIRDIMLRRRIRYVLRERGSCRKCRYSLIGLAVDAQLQVACPECGEISVVDSSLGELVRDQAGTVSYRPLGLAAEPHQEWLTPARKRLIKRFACGVGVFVFGVCPLLWGGYELFLRRQASQAAAAMIGSKGFLNRVRAAQDPGVGETVPDAWDAFFAAQALRQQVEEDWRSSHRSEEPGSADVPDVSGLMSRTLTSQTLEGRTAEIAERAAAKVLIAEYRDAGVYSALRELAARRRAVRPMPMDSEWGPFSYLVPELGQARAFARINGARMVLGFDAGDTAEFADAMESNLAISRILKRQPLLIDRLVASAIDELTMRILFETLASSPTPDLVEAMSLAIDRQWNALPLTEAIENERTYTLECINWVFAEPSRVRFGSLSPVLRAYSGMTSSSLIRGRLGTRTMNIDAANQLFNGYVQEAAKPPADRDFSMVDSGLDSNLVLLSAVISLPGRSLRAMTEAETKMNAIRCMIAIESFRSQNGEYPEAIDEISPRYIREIPADPWDSNGGRLRYRRIDPRQDPLQRGYLLYSVGIDGRDNSGASASDVAPGATPRPASGLDLIFNSTPPVKPALGRE